MSGRNGKDTDTERPDLAQLFDALMEATKGKLTLKQASEIWEKMKDD
jgi:hypothetical protein